MASKPWGNLGAKGLYYSDYSRLPRRIQEDPDQWNLLWGVPIPNRTLLGSRGRYSMPTVL